MGEGMENIGNKIEENGLRNKKWLQKKTKQKENVLAG